MEEKKIEYGENTKKSQYWTPLYISEFKLLLLNVRKLRKNMYVLA